MLGKVVAGAMGLGCLYVGQQLWSQFTMPSPRHHEQTTETEVEVEEEEESMVVIPSNALCRSILVSNEVLETIEFIGKNMLDTLDIMGHTWMFKTVVAEYSRCNTASEYCFGALLVTGGALLLYMKFVDKCTYKEPTVPLSIVLEVRRTVQEQFQVLEQRYMDLAEEFEGEAAAAEAAVEVLERREEESVILATNPPQ